MLSEHRTKSGTRRSVRVRSKSEIVRGERLVTVKSRRRSTGLEAKGANVRD